MIETERLILRPFREADFPAWYAVFSDPEIIRTYGGGLYKDKAEARDKFCAHALGNEKKYAITLKENDRVIGEINAADPNPWVKVQPSLFDKRGVSLSFAVLPAFQGKGYATEAAKAVMDFCFARGDEYVNAGFFRGNGSSEAVQKKLGLAFFGEHTYTRNGVTVDVVENIRWNT